MNLKIQVFTPLLFVLFALASCTKNIDVKVPDYHQQLVVEGNIEPGTKPYVYLTYSMPYFGDNSTSNISSYGVKNALVTVYDGFVTDTLKEVFAGQGIFYMAQSMTGVIGRNYDLTIQVNGKTYTSSTAIYPAVALDSLWNKHEKNDSLGYIWAHLDEPGNTSNQYRWFAKRIGKDNTFLAPLGSSFDDKFINGKSFDFAYDRAVLQNSTANDDNNIEKGYFKTGDVVVVKFCTIGAKEYRFLRSYDANMISNGNPFAAPSNVESNITGTDVIGLWCGYNPVYDTLVFQ